MKLKKIPNKYLFEYDPKYDNFFRKEISETLKSLMNLKLEDIPCPICNTCDLRIGNFGDSIFPEYHITCDSCEFTCPDGCSDYGESKCEFEHWAEAFYLLGKPMELVKDSNLTIYMYKEGESRRRALLMYTGDAND